MSFRLCPPSSVGIVALSPWINNRQRLSRGPYIPPHSIHLGCGKRGHSRCWVMGGHNIIYGVVWVPHLPSTLSPHTNKSALFYWLSLITCPVNIGWCMQSTQCSSFVFNGKDGRGLAKKDKIIDLRNQGLPSCLKMSLLSKLCTHCNVT